MKRLIITILFIMLAAFVTAQGIDSNTVLMLHADGDESASDHTYTAYGNSQLVSAGKFDGAVSLDGAGDYLSVADSSDWDFGNDNFTIDFWVKPSDTADQWWFGQCQDGPNRMIFGFNGDVLKLQIDGVSLVATTMTPDTSKFSHYALVRASGTYYLYEDGLLLNSEYNAGLYPDYNADFWVGKIFSASGPTDPRYFNGHIDEFRISKGIARWTGPFTPDTTPHTVDVDTDLLLSFDGDISDSSHDITFNGDVDVSASTYKFDGSYYFDGAGDFLSIPDSSDWDFGDGNFTIDFWGTLAAGNSAHDGFLGHGNSGANRVIFSYNNIFGKLYFNTVGGSSDMSLSASWVPTVNTWYHFAIVREGNNWHMFVDGIELSTSGGISHTFPDLSTDFEVGRHVTNADTYLYHQGYIDELRVSKGVVRWNSAFTPDTVPYNAVSNTVPTQSNPTLTTSGGAASLDIDDLICNNQSTSDADGDSVKNIIDWKLNGNSLLLLNAPFEGNVGDESAIMKDYSGHDGTVNGATWSGSTGYDSNGAYAFDGNDYISIPAGGGSVFDFYSSDFSLVGWFKSSNSGTIIGAAGAVAGADYYRLNLLANGQVECNLSNALDTIIDMKSPSTYDDGNWHHVACVKDGVRSGKLYIDGTIVDQDSEISGASAIDIVSVLSIGRWPDGTDYFTGVIDDVIVWDISISAEQVQKLYENRTDLIVSEETLRDQSWTCEITPNDGIGDGIKAVSNSIVLASLPDYTEFNSDGDTTDFSAENVSAVVDPILANSNVKVEWTGILDLDGADLDSAVQFNSNFVSVDSAALAVLNTRANITLKGINYDSVNTYYILKDGVACGDCIKYSANPVKFEVSGFSNYTTGGNSTSVPEFSTMTLGVGLFAVLVGLVLIRRRK